MKSSDFFGKLTSKYIWLNLAAMAAVLVVLAVGVKFGIDIYTHHGEAIPIPDIRRSPTPNTYLLTQGCSLK